MSDKTREILDERARTHGEYLDNARITMDIMRACETGSSWSTLPDAMKTSIFIIAMKLHRIVNGDPFVDDHWDDIAGYSRLVSERMDVLVAEPLSKIPEHHHGPSATTMMRSGLTDAQKIMREEMLRPGTPDDGGHHESAVDFEYDTGTVIENAVGDRDEHKMRRPRLLTHFEYQELGDQVVLDGTAIGRRWISMYRTPQNWETERATMFPEFMEEYGR